MKKILGLDLGTNSIGWALIEQDFDAKKGSIIDCGSRIIPMSQDIMGKFDSGQSVSQTAERTGYRSVRRLRQRHLLRRERLHRVLNILGFLPQHYNDSIDFINQKGQFKNQLEPKLNYFQDNNDKFNFLFKQSFQEMLLDFSKDQPDTILHNVNIPYDWTLYFLRNKALKEKISKYELAWIIMNFNQKRGYYQLRGEEEDTNKGKLVEFHALKVEKVSISEEENVKGQTIYKILLENGWSFNKPSKYPVDWEGKIREFIVTTDVEDDGYTPKPDKEGNVKRSFRSVDSEQDWLAIKKKTEKELDDFETAGQYIYHTLQKNPKQKIRGKLIRTIERKYYKEELNLILASQKRFHEELISDDLYQKCLLELYPNNSAHRENIKKRDFVYLFLDDIIFYQRPLKTKKSQIDGCRFEKRFFKNEGKIESVEVKCTSKSNPVFQEFRLWQFISNLKILKREIIKDNKIKYDYDISDDFLSDEESKTNLYDFLNDRREISQKVLLKFFGLNEKDYRWNYVEDKVYPCSDTLSSFIARLSRIEGVNAKEFLTNEVTYKLWHLIYSVSDKKEYEKAIRTFARKHSINEDDFFEQFHKYPPFKSDYAAYSEKAIKKLLSLMRMGRYWDEVAINKETRERIQKIIDGEFDEKIRIKVRDKAILLDKTDDFKSLPLWLASYIVYDRHAEEGEIKFWKSSKDIEDFLRFEFKQHSLRNPIVEQVVAETLRVVKDVWDYYGEGKENFFDEIHLELGREMKNPADKRKRMTNQNTENENTNQRIRELLLELKNEGIEEVRPYSPGQQEILKLYEEGVYFNSESVSDDILKIRRNPQPTTGEIKKYKLWLEQGYISPYTGKMIQLSRLFTPDYQIEHIIPQSRFFDDSLGNKVICEAGVNEKKGNLTGMEFIIQHGGETIELSGGRHVQILKKSAYEEHVRKFFKGNGIKIKNLLSEEIPESFLNRQLNDSRYISRVVKGLLSHIVREKDEQETTSKNLTTVSGAVTSKMKQDWGLNDVWNLIVYPRFERLNQMTNSNEFGQWVNKQGKRYFQTDVPFELKRGFNKKRIDHRHHTLDAIVIASVTREHVNYLNSLNSKTENFAYVKKLRRTENYNGRDYPKEFLLPWEGFNQEVKHKLENVMVSFKQNHRIINKTTNKYQKWVKDENGIVKKAFVSQSKGDSWAIRKPLHKETVYGKVNLKRANDTLVSFKVALENPDLIIDKNLKKQIKNKYNELGDPEEVKKYFKKNPILVDGEKLSKVSVYREFEATAGRVSLDSSFTAKKILTVTDTGIQKILLNHLESYNASDSKGKILEHPEQAFSEEGIETLNKNMVELNDGKKHQPIYKVRLYEEGNRFPVGYTGNKKDKFVEAAKGTNLFFAVYENKDKKRKFQTIGLNEAIERQKQGLEVAEKVFWDEKTGDEYHLLFTLSPNDLVYVPTEEERNNSRLVDFSNLNSDQLTRVYKMVSARDARAFFIKNEVSTSIYNKFEYTSMNKMERTINGDMIKESCLKINLNRIGKIIS
jgi:CRISPR-associated endonuclease Csn1